MSHSERELRYSYGLFVCQVNIYFIIKVFDASGTGVNTLQIKGGSRGTQIIDSNSNSLMDLCSTQVSVNKPLVCSSSVCFTGYVTASYLCCNKTEVDTDS